MAKKRKRRHLGEILYAKKLIDKPTLKKAILKSRADHVRLGEHLIENDLVSEDDVTKAIAKQFSLEYVDLD
ncbi:MAG: glycosyl transferase, partial [Planctomycetes bacterium]|nr:glycosyl transferase [Planctomycetota bacterium]